MVVCRRRGRTHIQRSGGDAAKTGMPTSNTAAMTHPVRVDSMHPSHQWLVNYYEGRNLLILNYYYYYIIAFITSGIVLLFFCKTSLVYNLDCKFFVYLLYVHVILQIDYLFLRPGGDSSVCVRSVRMMGRTR